MCGGRCRVMGTRAASPLFSLPFFWRLLPFLLLHLSNGGVAEVAALYLPIDRLIKRWHERVHVSYVHRRVQIDDYVTILVYTTLVIALCHELKEYNWKCIRAKCWEIIRLFTGKTSNVYKHRKNREVSRYDELENYAETVSTSGKHRCMPTQRPVAPLDFATCSILFNC